MIKYKKIYMDFFNLGEQDFIYCEFNYMQGKQIKAVDFHHIRHGANKVDHINNLMALSREVHDKAHKEHICRNELEQIHGMFINNNPYV